MRARVLTALVGIPLLLMLIGLGRPWHFSLLVFAVTVGGLCEYFFITFPDLWGERILGIVLGGLISLVNLLPDFPEPELFLGVALVGAFSIYLFCGGELGQRYRHLGWTLCGAFYIGYLFPHYVLIYRGPEGKSWVFLVLLVVAAGDTAGYFIGTALGKRKLCPEISPGKTVAGAVGSLIASVVGGLLGASLLLNEMHWIEALLLSLVLSLLGQVGDLFESWFKRVFSVKDSGTLIPGHGGLLDRIDSLVFPAVYTTYYVRLLHS